MHLKCGYYCDSSFAHIINKVFIWKVPFLARSAHILMFHLPCQASKQKQIAGIINEYIKLVCIELPTLINPMNGTAGCCVIY